MHAYLPLIIVVIATIATYVTIYTLRDRFEILQEFIAFLAERKMMWIAPLVIVFVLASVLALVAGHAAMASIYPLF